MYGQIQQNNLCIDIEVGHVPAIAKLSPCSSDKDTQVYYNEKKLGDLKNFWNCLVYNAKYAHGVAISVDCDDCVLEALRFFPSLFAQTYLSQYLEFYTIFYKPFKTE